MIGLGQIARMDEAAPQIRFLGLWDVVAGLRLGFTD